MERENKKKKKRSGGAVNMPCTSFECHVGLHRDCAGEDITKSTLVYSLHEIPDPFFFFAPTFCAYPPPQAVAPRRVSAS